MHLHNKNAEAHVRDSRATMRIYQACLQKGFGWRSVTGLMREDCSQGWEDIRHQTDRGAGDLKLLPRHRRCAHGIYSSRTSPVLTDLQKADGTLMCPGGQAFLLNRIIQRGCD
jgi:hypothetical protein